MSVYTLRRQVAEQTVRGASSVRVEKGGRSKLWPLLALLVLLIAVIVGLVLYFAGRNTKDARKDVSVRSCKADPKGGKPTASGVILNNSSETSNYVIKLKFNDASGNKVSEGVAPVKDVESKKTAKWELTGGRSAKGELKCVVTGVSRNHLPGQ